MNTINLETEILRENTKTLAAEKIHLDEQAKLDAEVDKVLQAADEKYRGSIMSELGFEYKHTEAQKIIRERELLARFPSNRIMSKDALKSTCIKYGLRFLPTRLFKGQLDAGIGPALEKFKGYCGSQEGVVLHMPEMIEDNSTRGLLTATQAGKSGPQYYIAAPADEFVLKPVPRDPLLFARLTFDKFFLIHKWGSDLKTADIRKGQTTESNWNSEYTGDPMSDLMTIASGLRSSSSVLRRAELAGMEIQALGGQAPSVQQAMNEMNQQSEDRRRARQMAAILRDSAVANPFGGLLF